MAAVVAPVLQEKFVPPVAVSVVLLPLQIEWLPVIAAVTLDAEFTVMLAVLEQLPDETKTEYVVEDVGETMIEEVLSPVDHE